MATEEIYHAIDDPIYSATSQKPPVDKDTQYRQSGYISASSNGSATLATGLNSGQMTTFEITQGSGMKLRWGTMALRLRMTITALADTAATCPVSTGEGAAPCNIPPWNMVASLIKSIKLELNSGDATYVSQSDHYLEDFTARMIRNYPFDVLQTKGDCLFTPIDDVMYIYQNIDAATPVAVECLDTASAARAAYYCDNAFTMNKQITKIVSFLDLFPRMSDSIYKNLRKIKITIEWVNTKDLLDHRDTVVAGYGGVSLTNADILTDHYVLAPGQSTATLTEKINNELDYIPYLNSHVYPISYVPGTDIIIPGIKNFDSVMIFQIAKGFTNGKAGAEGRTYSSNSQFLMFGNSAAGTNKQIRPTCDYPSEQTTGKFVDGLSSVQISFGGIRYPSQAITTQQSANAINSFDASGLYYEYLKAINRYGKTISAGIPYDTFRSTLPFILMRPFASDAVKPSSEGKDLVISLSGGTASTISVVVFTYHCTTMGSDGFTKDY